MKHANINTNLGQQGIRSERSDAFVEVKKITPADNLVNQMKHGVLIKHNHHG